MPLKRLWLSLPLSLLLSLLLATCTLSARAHETWLLPEDFTPPAGQSVRFTMTSGMGFPDLGSGIDRRRLVEAVLVQDGDRQRLVPAGAREGALLLTGIPEGGMACAWVRLEPRVLEIPDAADVEHYLEEIGAPRAVWSAWRSDEGRSVWRESYSKLARSYLRGEGGVTGAPCTGVTSGARFDILPLVDPTTLAAGEALDLQVLFDGEPLSGQAVGLIYEGDASGVLLRSDADGRLSVTPENAGRYMIYATNLRPVSGEDFNWESDFTTLTFEVQGE
jgi:hypothetical protein